MTTIHPSAEVADGAVIGESTKVWHLAQIREGAVIGESCIIGRGAYIGPGVSLGARTKVQNHALVYEPATIAEGVFIGPAVVLTNDRSPRAITADGSLKGADDWYAPGIAIATGASIGAGAIVVAGVRVGAWALVGAGAVVTRSVPAYGLVVGNPARRIGWVDESGTRLESIGDGRWAVPGSGRCFVEDGPDSLQEERDVSAS